jgi:hypothetical protein
MDMEPNNEMVEAVPSVTVYLPDNLHALPGSRAAHVHPVRHGNQARATWQRRLVLFWSISGGTILSIVGFGALTLYQQYNDSLTELRNDLKHFNESSADLVKKESLRNQMNFVFTSLKDLQAANTSNCVRDTRVSQLEEQLRVAETDRKDLVREVQRLRERLAGVEGRLAATPPGSPISRADK